MIKKVGPDTRIMSIHFRPVWRSVALRRRNTREVSQIWRRPLLIKKKMRLLVRAKMIVGAAISSVVRILNVKWNTTEEVRIA